MISKWMKVFAAGALAGLANSLVVWLFGQYGISQSLGVAISPALSPSWLYPRIVWGGLWGFLFLIPVLNSRPWSKGMLLSLFPTLVQLLVVFPYQTGHGVGGLQLGLLTPVLVVFFNAVWGVTAALALRLAR